MCLKSKKLPELVRDQKMSLGLEDKASLQLEACFDIHKSAALVLEVFLEVNSRVLVPVSDFNRHSNFLEFSKQSFDEVCYFSPSTRLCYSLLCCCFDINGKRCLSTAPSVLCSSSFVL